MRCVFERSAKTAARRYADLGAVAGGVIIGEPRKTWESLGYA